MSFELPAALSLRVAHPPFLYGSAVIFFGVCTVCTSAARTYASVMVLRLLLGFGESFVQTGFVFLSLWYTKEEMTTRCGASLLQGILVPWFGFGYGPQRLDETNNLISILFRFHSTGWCLFRSNSLWNQQELRRKTRQSCVGVVLSYRGVPYYLLGSPGLLILAQTSRNDRKEWELAISKPSRTCCHDATYNQRYE